MSFEHRAMRTPAYENGKNDALLGRMKNPPKESLYPRDCPRECYYLGYEHGQLELKKAKDLQDWHDSFS